MHFIVSWDIPSKITNRESYENNLIECFNNFQSYKPVTTFYIIRVNTQLDYTNILNQLQNVGKNIGSGFKLVVSPIMNGGRYDGLLDNESWNIINQISG